MRKPKLSTAVSRTELIASYAYGQAALATPPPPPPPAKSPVKDEPTPPAGDKPYEPAPYHADADETVICPACEKHNDLDASYCDQCGAKLAGSTEVKIDPPPAAEADPEKPEPPVPAARAQAAMASGRDAAWDLLSQALSSLGQHLLYNPDPNAGPGDWADLNPDTLVPAGTIRAALGVAGGASAATLTPDVAGAVTFTDAVGQIGTGSTIAELITAGGGQREGYEWVYGPALNGFPPHEDLDGVQFESFDDDALANPGDFPANQYFLPGDHDGCVCDFMPIYLGPDESDG